MMTNDPYACEKLETARKQIINLHNKLAIAEYTIGLLKEKVMEHERNINSGEPVNQPIKPIPD